MAGFFWNAFKYLFVDTRAFTLENPNTPINGTTVGELFGGTSTYSGEKVDTKIALNFSAVWACSRILSDIISSMPLKIYQKTTTGRREATDHPFYTAATSQPNDIYTKTIYLKRAIIHYLNWGNHLAETNFRKNQYTLIHPSRFIRFEETARGKLIYVISDGLDENRQPTERKITSDKILHVPNLGEELWGMGVVEQAKNTIGLEIATEKYGNRFFKTGGVPQGIISMDKSITPKQQNDVQDSHKVMMERGGTMVAPAGVDYKSIVLPPEAMQFLGTREFSVSEISRWYGVPLSKLGNLDRATFNNIEHLSIEFLQDSIQPILAAIENEYTNKILEDGFYFEFNMDAYLRADTKTKSEIYRTFIQNSLMTPDEIRAKENLEPQQDGDRLLIQSNMIHLDRLDDLMKPETKTEQKNSNND